MAEWLLGLLLVLSAVWLIRWIWRQ